MNGLSRREIVVAAVALGCAPAFARAAARSTTGWHEARPRFPQGVASGDPEPDSIILWTRYVPSPGEPSSQLRLEVAEDEAFDSVIATRRVRLSAAADGTCRVLVGGLGPGRTYWYRFTAADGSGSRIGRTRTAPMKDDDGTAVFAFVSCQNVTMGPLTAWRRMLFDDARAAAADQIGFVLHLGDFVYEDMLLPEAHPGGYFDRTLTPIRYPHGELHGDFEVPATLEDYRTLYRKYLLNPDLQDARARWPFVAIWDNGEYSNKGWQGLQRFGTDVRPAQRRKVAANQAWFEYIPSRARTADGSLEAFAAPAVADAPIQRFDAAGLGLERNNLAAIESLTAYRTHRWGRHVELILTDQRSYRSDDFTGAPEAKAIASPTFPQMVPYETLTALDAGRGWGGGRPPARLRFGDAEVANFQADKGPRSILGDRQKAWFLDRLAGSTATWKIWANTVATFDMRADPQNLPEGLTAPWPGTGYAGYARTDHSTAFTERAEIFDFVAQRDIGGFVTVSGDRHSFWAGYSAKALPPDEFRPVGINFVTGSISSPGMVEAFEYALPKSHPLRSLYLVDRPGRPKPEPAVNLLLRHGVRTCLDYAASGDLARAKTLSNPGNAPHVEFVDMGGHGFSIVRATSARIDVEFVCVPRPVVATSDPAGGPLRYRVTHSADLWDKASIPKLVRSRLEGDAGLSA